MTQGGYLHLPSVSEVLPELALLGADAGQRREVVRRRDMQWCQHNNLGLFVTIIFRGFGGKCNLGILTKSEVPNGSAANPLGIKVRQGSRGQRCVPSLLWCRAGCLSVGGELMGLHV